ncbi:MAG: hypothetical protein A2563_05185 [Candidatus Magasanikbacteria bacterium RIFOXYD1_FULL_40_23]|uniref:Glycerol-3-phosphate dehydrogenase [NAD(P)+] n=1 Tax=Candidatus Magasanikbacteria bacterium RIFOXYD1_FULL_40_23 TaxID=1798705 RepID=A0A1F6P853_9BACT|nr:MAG: hypothetical protein A2563_05185 [Candidatus Magasanikbacteria bacterium RIFOXYD1_FULL_40_23]
MLQKEKVAVLGAGNMGTAVAQVIASNGFEVRIWNHAGDLEPLQQIKELGENKNYLPGVKLSTNIVCEPDISQAVKGASIVFVVVPSGFVKNVVQSAAPYIPKSATCVDVSKGLDFEGAKYSLTTDVLGKLLPKNKIASISGPAIAGQMALGKFTAMNVVSEDKNAIKMVKKVMENENLKLVSSSDIIGVETSGSFKNVYAIAMGICDGLELPTNTKAILFTTALKEMVLIVKKMGGQSETVYGLAGLGDLAGTGLASASRNRRFGEFLGKGLTPDEAVIKVERVVEGMSAVKALNILSKKYKLKMPLGDLIYRIIYSKADPKKEIDSFLKNLA